MQQKSLQVIIADLKALLQKHADRAQILTPSEAKKHLDALESFDWETNTLTTADDPKGDPGAGQP